MEFGGIIILAVGILAFFIPFFVFRIRNEIISLNKKVSILVDILRKKESDNEDIEERIEFNEGGDKIKICQFCGGKNRMEYNYCIKCHAILP